MSKGDWKPQIEGREEVQGHNIRSRSRFEKMRLLSVSARSLLIVLLGLCFICIEGRTGNFGPSDISSVERTASGSFLQRKILEDQNSQAGTGNDDKAQDIGKQGEEKQEQQEKVEAEEKKDEPVNEQQSHNSKMEGEQTREQEKKPENKVKVEEKKVEIGKESDEKKEEVKVGEEEAKEGEQKESKWEEKKDLQVSEKAGTQMEVKKEDSKLEEDHKIAEKQEPKLEGEQKSEETEPKVDDKQEQKSEEKEQKSDDKQDQKLEEKEQKSDDKQEQKSDAKEQKSDDKQEQKSEEKEQESDDKQEQKSEEKQQNPDVKQEQEQKSEEKQQNPDVKQEQKSEEKQQNSDVKQQKLNAKEEHNWEEEGQKSEDKKEEQKSDDKKEDPKLGQTNEQQKIDQKDEQKRVEKKDESNEEAEKEESKVQEEVQAGEDIKVNLKEEQWTAAEQNAGEKKELMYEQGEKPATPQENKETDRPVEAYKSGEKVNSEPTRGAADLDEDYPDFLDEFMKFPESLQKTAETVKGHMSGLEKYSAQSKQLFDHANQQIQESFRPLIGKEYAPLIAYLVSYGLLFLPLALVMFFLERIRAILSLQKILLFVNIYLSAYFGALVVATFVLGTEPMNFLRNVSASSYIFLQLLQAFGYLMYLLLQTIDLLSTCSVGRISAKFSAVLQWVVVVAVGFHYYVTVFLRAMARKAPLTSWKIYGLYTLCFVFLCLFARIERGKKQYTPAEEDNTTDKKN